MNDSSPSTVAAGSPGSAEELSPETIADALERRVLGQQLSVREMSIALYKKLRGLGSGNILLIGSSGSGKTTLMRAVEEYLAAAPEHAGAAVVIRIHAKVLAEESESSRAGEGVLRRLLERCRQLSPEGTPVAELIEQASRGIVFVDEVDKIRSKVGGRPHVECIRAQEALLTLIENEAVPFELPEWAGGEVVSVDSRDILFVCAGAFEGLYDSVYDRVTVGEDRGLLQPVSVMEGGTVQEKLHFTLNDWLRIEDLFAYGMTPQFLSRFDARIVLNDLSEENLLHILLESPDSGLRAAQAYFKDRGLRLAISPRAARRIAREAAAQPRLGARALKEIFRKVIGRYEFAPESVGSSGAVMSDEDEVEAALASS